MSIVHKPFQRFMKAVKTAVGWSLQFVTALKCGANETYLFTPLTCLNRNNALPTFACEADRQSNSCVTDVR